MLKKIFVSLTTFIPATSWAFFCPTNFNQIDYGQTIEQVEMQCGKADKSETVSEQPEGPQEWSYYIPQTVGANGATPMTGTMKTQMTFDSQGKAVNISVNGIGVGATTICGPNIQLGDSRDAVKAACGNPSFVNKQNGDAAALGPLPDKRTVTTLTYNSNPPIKLIFINGQLKERQ